MEEDNSIPVAQEIGVSEYLDLAIDRVTSNPVSLLTGNWEMIVAVIALFVIRRFLPSKIPPP